MGRGHGSVRASSRERPEWRGRRSASYAPGRVDRSPARPSAVPARARRPLPVSGFAEGRDSRAAAGASAGVLSSSVIGCHGCFPARSAARSIGGREPANRPGAFCRAFAWGNDRRILRAGVPAVLRQRCYGGASGLRHVRGTGCGHRLARGQHHTSGRSGLGCARHRARVLRGARVHYHVPHGSQGRDVVLDARQRPGGRSGRRQACHRERLHRHHRSHGGATAACRAKQIVDQPKIEELAIPE